MRKIKNLSHAALIGLSGIVLASCGNSDGAEQMMGPSMADKKNTNGGMSDKLQESTPEEMKNGVVAVKGIVKKVSIEKSRIKIKHEPVPAMKMGAMTMSFKIAGDVDLSELSRDDEVEFMLKKGRDGSYRIMSICKQSNDDTSCLGEADE